MTIKDTLADLGTDTLKEFFAANPSIPEPVLNLYRDVDHTMTRRIKKVGTCGFYRNDVIHVAVPLCASMNPMYSWAGFISDRTPYGVIQHELGHHVDQVLSGFDVYSRQPKVTLDNLPLRGGLFSTEIRHKSGEPAITSYSPNTMEWFAEIFRLFVTNPCLLALIRPRAYDALLEAELMPCTDLDERQVLEQFKAPPRIYERMDKWLKNKK
jgi:hypothetical protein